MKLRVSFERDEELAYILWQLNPIIASYKVSPSDAKRPYRRAYICTKQLLEIPEMPDKSTVST